MSVSETTGEGHRDERENQIAPRNAEQAVQLSAPGPAKGSPRPERRVSVEGARIGVHRLDRATLPSCWSIMTAATSSGRGVSRRPTTFPYPQGIIPGSGEGYGVSLSKGRTIGGPLLLLVE